MGMNRSPQFALGTFSTARGVPFAGLVLGDSAAPLEKLASRTRGSWAGSSGPISVLSLLEEWDENLALLREIAVSLGADEEKRRIKDEAFVPISTLKVHPPVNLPR